MGANTELTVAVIGCGALGTAIAAGVLDAPAKDGISLKRLIATVGTEASKQHVEGALSAHAPKLSVLLGNENARAAQEADVVLLAVKPAKRADVFSDAGFRAALGSKLILSIMAGITTTEVRRLVRGDNSQGADDGQPPLQAVRAMPNMAARIRRAVTLYTGAAGTTEASLATAAWVFGAVGQAQRIADERSFDICAVLVGCAGSLLLLAVDGLLDAAVAEGIKRPEAQSMVVNSAIGMMQLVPEAGAHPSVLREQIASPGGCSIRALLELERQGVRSSFTSAILAAAERSKQMSSS